MSSSTKVFNAFLLYGVIPLFMGVYANKVSFIVALDLAVWLIALVAFFLLVKTPVELYYAVKTKIAELELKKKRGLNVSYDLEELAALELRMFYISWATPFAAIVGWYALGEFCARYRLDSMTELIHPYFVLMVGTAAGLLPVLRFRERLKARLATIGSIPLTVPVAGGLGGTGVAPAVVVAPVPTTNNTVLAATHESQKRLQGDVDQCKEQNTKLEYEMRQLRRETKAYANSKNEEIQKLERKIIGLENQIELLQMLRKEGIHHEKGILDALVSNPLKALGVKH